MKFHKIKGVNKNICTCEQKIAYNFAFADYDWAMRSNMQLQEYLDNVTQRIKGNAEITKKYDIDAIVHCLRQGFINFCKAECHVLISYEDIGRMFPSLYPVD